jgi:hypothetical protein
MRVNGSVMRADDARAVGGASIRVLSTRAVVTSGSRGRFVLQSSAGDTLVTSAIGFRPDTTVISSVAAEVVVRLETAPITLSDLVAGPGADQSLGVGAGGNWRIDASAVKLMPVAVEPDVLRILQLVPAISFSSLLSARPLIRGVDADDAGVDLNGFEVVNMYHVGRIISAFPALAAKSVELNLQPMSAAAGRSTSGRIGIEGRMERGDAAPTVQYGFGAVSAATGWDGAISGWVTGRSVRGSVLNGAATAGELPFGFEDLYLGMKTSTPGLPSLELTVFHSSDRIGNEGETDAYLRWRNDLIGGKWNALRSNRLALKVTASYSRHYERGEELEARGDDVDVLNEFRRIGTATTALWTPGLRGLTVSMGAEFGTRRIVNLITPDTAAPRVPSADRRLDRAEYGGYVELVRKTTPLEWRIGMRVDGTSQVASLQPRASARVRTSERSWVGVGLGRATRLQHIVSDARTEPKLAYYDIWLPAGVDGIPTATLNHATLEVGRELRNGRLRFGVFGAVGDGVIDLQLPEAGFDPATPYRFGRVRLGGVDADMRIANASGAGIAISYAYTISQRDWGEGWTDWIHERRHQVRAAGLFRPPLGTVFSGTVELGSGYRYTPILGFAAPVPPSRPDLTNLFGVENSAVGPWTLRVDAALVKPFGGPFGLAMEAGVSITNANFGETSSRAAGVVRGGNGGLPKATSNQGPALPAIPSIVLRASLPVK